MARKKRSRKRTKYNHAHTHFLYGSLTVLGGIVLTLAFYAVSQMGVDAKKPTSAGFDQFGYNEQALKFNGKADGVDRKLDGTVWGDPTYGNDHLTMNWNSEWQRGNDENWTDPNGYNGAWTDNHWNGQVKDGSGEVWHYQIKWVGDCTADITLVPEGGYCIWNQFAVTMSQGSVANQHFWDAHATPTGKTIFPN